MYIYYVVLRSELPTSQFEVSLTAPTAPNLMLEASTLAEPNALAEAEPTSCGDQAVMTRNLTAALMINQDLQVQETRLPLSSISNHSYSRWMGKELSCRKKKSTKDLQ